MDKAIIISHNCNNCAAPLPSADKHSKCTYCGTPHSIIVDKKPNINLQKPPKVPNITTDNKKHLYNILMILLIPCGILIMYYLYKKYNETNKLKTA